MKIRRHVITALMEFARESSPSECCGLLTGDGHVIERLYRLRNISPTPRTRYFADPEEIFKTMVLFRHRGEQLMGIYHSHTHTAAHPSPTDVEQAYYPESVYFISSLAPKQELRAFRITEGAVEEIEYEIVDDSP